MSQHGSERRGVVLSAAAAVCFGVTTPISRELLSHVEPVTLAGLLYVGAALAAAPLALRQRTARIERSDWRRLAIAVIVGGGISPILLLVALDRVPSPTVSILLNLELVATVILAWAVFREHVHARTVVAVAFVVAAGVVLGWEGGSSLEPAALLVALACIGWGIDNSATANLRSLSPAQITTAKGVVAGAVNVLIGVSLFGGGAVPLSVAAGAMAVGAVGYGASIMLWIAGARLIGASRGQAIFAAAPFIGVALAWPIAGERLDATAALALVLAAVGVTIVTGQHLSHVHLHEAVTHSHTHRHDDGHHEHHDSAALRTRRHRHVHSHQATAHEHSHRHLPRNHTHHR